MTVTAFNGATPFEYQFAKLLGPNILAFAFWKGRVALFAILKALDIHPGDEVILPGFTCVVVPNAVYFAGGCPVFVDIETNGYNLDPDQVEAAITPRTRAILVQHTFGIPADLEQIVDIAVQHGLYLIEDCAHTLGADFNARPLGTIGHAAFFSTQWSKPFTTGLGGLAVTRDPALANRLRRLQAGFDRPSRAAQLRLFAQYQLYQHFFSPALYWRAKAMLNRLGHLGLFVGSSSHGELNGQMPADHTWRLSEYQHKTGVTQLSALGPNLVRRRLLSEYYDHALIEAGWPITPRPAAAPLLRYPVRAANKQALLESARRQRIELGSWFETPLHPTPLAQHAGFGYQLGACPRAEAAARQVINLPLHGRVSLQEARRIIDFFLTHADRLDSNTG